MLVNIPVGKTIPETAHAISVSLPTWSDNVGYEEGDPLVVNSMQGGYPRFVYHPLVKKLFVYCLKKFGTSNEGVLVYNSHQSCIECRMFMNKHLKKTTKESYIRIVDFVISPASVEVVEEQTVLNILFFPSEYSSLAKEFWQHTGLGVSSRFAEYCLVKLGQELPKIPFKVKSLGGTSRTKVEQQVTDSHSQIIHQQNEKIDASLYIEERFGRNLTLDLANEAKIVLRKRIAGSMVDSDDQTIESNRVSAGVTFHDVKLFPSGMSAIYAAHKVAISLNPELKTIQFGFPYIDTLKLQEKFGNGVIFYGNGNDEDLAELKLLLENTQIAAVFCEFPSNPLLKSPPLKELWKLAQEHDFLIIVDETIVVSSLTKIFSGDSNVMGGSLVINPKSNLYTKISACLNGIYADNLWFEDAIYLERNSRQFINRIKLINTNAEILCDLLKTHPLVSQVYYPKYITPELYKDVWTWEGYGGLFSIVLKDEASAKLFYDRISCFKGPSLGTNFTLACPYTILAHYNELDWATEYGVVPYLVRVSVGLENIEELKEIFLGALNSILDE